MKGRREISLDGTWQILFDPANAGVDQGWHVRANVEGQDAVEPIREPAPLDPESERQR